MMKVRLKTTYASPTRRGRPGQVMEFDEKEGIALVTGGYGEEVGNPIIEETDDITALLSLSVGKITENFPAIDDEELQQLLIAEEKAEETRVTLIKAIKEEQSSRDKS